MMVLGHVLVEPGAAAVLARAYVDREEIRGKRIVLVVSGANVDNGMIVRALSTPALGG
jgi:threonine dehydratase